MYAEFLDEPDRCINFSLDEPEECSLDEPTLPRSKHIACNMMIESRFTNEVQVVDFGGPAFKVDLNLKLDIFQKQGVYTDSSRLHTSGSSRPSYFWFI